MMFALRIKRTKLVLVVAATALGLLGTSWAALRKDVGFIRRSTMGDLEVIHSRVLLGGVAAQATTRLAAGDEITTDAAGRAKLWLADGVFALLDANSVVKLAAGRLELARGRLFVDSPEGRKLTVVSGPFETPLSASKATFERLGDGSLTKIFCAQGEVMVSAGAAPTRVPSGETLTASGGKTSVEPEKAFDDWTGGLAVPWAAKRLPRSTLAEVWTTAQGEPISPLHVSSEAIAVTLKGEFAITRKKSRFYNGNDSAVTPTVRFALPPNAILTKVAHRLSAETRNHEATLEVCHQSLSNDVNLPRLEWAGNGWLSGLLPQVPAGGSIDLELEYGEWLEARSGRVHYRVPVGRRDESPLVGELSVVVDAEGSSASSVEANQGAVVAGKSLSWRLADVKPSDDWVVSYVPSILQPKVVRAYVESSKDNTDPYVMMRTETVARATQGVEVAIVVDSSRSVGISGLDLARQVVDALLGNLSEKDRVVLFVADEEAKSLGPATPTFATKALRETLATQLSQVRPGGASHLVKALERAADALDATNDVATSKMVVYLGDGRPSLGELTADRIRAQLQRRASGIPRLAGIALGANADRWLLAQLVAGTGPVHSVIDRSEAAQVAASVVSAVEEATHRDVKFDLGPNIDRIYPREGRAAAADSTVMVLGRLRGTLPQTIQLSYRDGAGTKVETLRVERQSSPSDGEIARRWALARVDEIVAGNEGIEPALLLAQQHELLLPWTEWVLLPNQQNTRQTCSSFSRRIVELSSLNDSPYARRIEAPPPPGGGWLEPPLKYDPGQSLEQGATASGRARISAAKTSLAACRDLRLPIIANLPTAFDYRIELGVAGRVERATLIVRDSGRRDNIFIGCLERVIRNLAFVGAERPITIEGRFTLPQPKDSRRSKCSIAASLPLALRRNVWAVRQGDAITRYERALNSCETSTWVDRRELLLDVMRSMNTGSELVKFAEQLAEQGHSDAADFVRSDAVRRISTLDELKELRHAILGSEPNLDADIATKVRRATTDTDRLGIVTRALAMAPHSPLGRRLQLLLLERLGEPGPILREVEAMRSDPFTDAGLIALAAAALRRQNQTTEAQRTFSELFERAPSDPWVLAFTGDQLRAEGFAEQALVAYESLERVVPNDTATLLRTGMAQAAVGRIDIATRLLDRAAQTAGRNDDQRLNELGAVVRAVVLGRATTAATNPVEKLELTNRLAQTALPDVAAIVLIEVPASPEQGVRVQAYRGDDKAAVAPDLDASPLGLAAIWVDRGAQNVKIEVSRQTLAGLGRPLPVTLSVLYLGEQPKDRRLRQVNAEVPLDQEKTSVKLNVEERL